MTAHDLNSTSFQDTSVCPFVNLRDGCQEGRRPCTRRGPGVVQTAFKILSFTAVAPSSCVNSRSNPMNLLPETRTRRFRRSPPRILYTVPEGFQFRPELVQAACYPELADSLEIQSKIGAIECVYYHGQRKRSTVETAPEDPAFKRFRRTAGSVAKAFPKSLRPHAVWFARSPCLWVAGKSSPSRTGTGRALFALLIVIVILNAIPGCRRGVGSSTW